MTAQQKEQTFGFIQQWITPLLIALVGFLGQVQFSDIRNDLKEMKAFMTEAKSQNAVLQRDIMYLERKIEEHEKWLDDLDKKVNN